MGPILDATASLVEYKEVKFCEFDLEEQEVSTIYVIQNWLT